jgi:L-alanine-DL-glutamate epimerase-like enolase superfamily enzyme
MKITAIKTSVCNAEMRNWVFVRVETDQPGLYGWGEATLEWKTRAVFGAIQDLEPPHVEASLFNTKTVQTSPIDPQGVNKSAIVCSASCVERMIYRNARRGVAG